VKRKRRDNEILSLSFLDCICCGFGAMILLLITAMVRQPQIERQRRENRASEIAALRQELEQLQADGSSAAQSLRAENEKLSPQQKRNAELRVERAAVEAALARARAQSAAPAAIEASLAAAQQQLSEEMKRLYGEAAAPRRPDAPIGGIPIDSEYVVFVIDTSGSMTNFAWPDVLEKVGEALDVYPHLQGIQVLNDQGTYMFPRYRGSWIPDTPSQRRAIADTLRTWRPFSASSPVEGIETAIRSFYAPDRKISVYVFSDDYSGTSVGPVVREIDRLNHATADGSRLVRIHAIGFPVQYRKDQVTRSGYRFAHLMRVLCERNGGAFVGLPKLHGGGAAELLR
jgi:hypothetical protein